MEWCAEPQTVNSWTAKPARDQVPVLRELTEFEPLEMPGDLGNWVCPATLLTWVVQATEAQLQTQVYQRTSALFQGQYSQRLMVGLLAFAYGRRIYDPHAIIAACRTDDTLRRFCKGEVPFAVELMVFRRRNRCLLESVLTRVFMKAVRHRFDLGDALIPEELEADLRNIAAQRLDTARHMAAC